MNFREFKKCAASGLENARRTLSILTGRDVTINSQSMGFVELGDIPALSGSPEDVVLASYVTFDGDARGQLMILFKPDSAEKLVSVLSPHLTSHVDPKDMSRLLDSTVSEVANIVGSSVLNAIADGAGMTLKPSPPILIREMSGAILESVVATCSRGADRVYVVDIKFSAGEGKALFEIVFLPDICTNSSGFWIMGALHGPTVDSCKTF